MRKTMLTIAILMSASVAAAPAFAQKNVKGYSRTVARAQIESLYEEAQRRGSGSPAQLAKLKAGLTAHPERVDILADVIASEGVDIGAPTAGLRGAALLDGLVAKMSDGRGVIETDLVAGRQRAQVGVGGVTNISTSGSRPTAPTIGSIAPAAPGPSGVTSKSMVGTILDQLWEEADGDVDKYYELAEKAADYWHDNPVPKQGSNSTSTPSPEGTRAKPSQLTEADLAKLGAKQGQVTNPAPEGTGAPGGGAVVGGSGAIPTVAGGGVSNPGLSSGTKVQTGLPTNTLPAKPQVVDPTRNDDGTKPAGGNTPSTPGVKQPGG